MKWQDNDDMIMFFYDKTLQIFSCQRVDYVCVWIGLLRFSSAFSFFLFFFCFFHAFSLHLRLLFMYGTWTVAATFDQIFVNSTSVHCLRTHKFHFFMNFFIKNGSHSTIYTFKNYFITVISTISFQFQQNKSYPNRPIYVRFCYLIFFNIKSLVGL